MCLPPDPALVGDNWRAMWLERLQNSVWSLGDCKFIEEFPALTAP
jgi:hypothetical protein